MLHHFDHRLGTYEGQTEAQANMGTLPRLTPEQHDDPNFVPMPRYWVPEFDVPKEKVDRNGDVGYDLGVKSRLDQRGWNHQWFIGWRDICRGTDARTLIPTASRIDAAFEGGTLLALPRAGASAAVVLLACMASYVVDYIARQKVGGTHLKYFVMRQLPILAPEVADVPVPWEQDKLVGQWLAARVVELSVTAADMSPLARDLGLAGDPFRWNEERRALLRAELDAGLFRLYGLGRDDIEYVMGSFPVIQRQDEATHGTYRTRDLILEAYDRMADAERDGTMYETHLSPPAGAGPRHSAQSDDA